MKRLSGNHMTIRLDAGQIVTCSPPQHWQKPGKPPRKNRRKPAIRTGGMVGKVIAYGPKQAWPPAAGCPIGWRSAAYRPIGG